MIFVPWYSIIVYAETILKHCQATLGSFIFDSYWDILGNS